MSGGLGNTSPGLAELLAAAWFCGWSLMHPHPAWGCAACRMETPKPSASPNAGVGKASSRQGEILQSCPSKHEALKPKSLPRAELPSSDVVVCGLKSQMQVLNPAITLWDMRGPWGSLHPKAPSPLAGWRWDKILAPWGMAENVLHIP